MRTFVIGCYLAGLIGDRTNIYIVLKGGLGHHGYTLTKRLLLLRQVHVPAFDLSVRRIHGLGNMNGSSNLNLSTPCRRAWTLVRQEALDLLERSRWSVNFDLV